MVPAIATLCSLLAFPALAAPSGLLVGLRDSHNNYRTIWIVAEGGAPAVAASVKGLVVPRETGLWHLDVEHVSCGDMGQYAVDELHIRALDASSTAPPTMDCESMARASCGDVAGLALASERWISYVGPTHFAEAFRSVKRCGTYPVEEAGHSVHELGRPEQDVPIETAFGADGMDALQVSAREALVCGTDDLDCIDSRDRYRMSTSSGWGIVRDVNHWSVLVSMLPPGPGRFAPSPVVTGVPPPEAILGRAAGGQTPVLSDALPEGDRSISPDGDMALVRTGRVVAYPLATGSVAGPPVPIPTRRDERVVMIEWAPPSRVRPWGAVLRGLSENAEASQSEGIAQVDWLQGCWESVSERGIIEEHWMAPRGDSMLGVSRTLRDGVLADYELMVLREAGDGLAFEAHPAGRSSVAFVASTLGGQRVVFENPRHDFPQRIGYERQGDGLLSWIEGTERGELRRLEFPYRRAACPGQRP